MYIYTRYTHTTHARGNLSQTAQDLQSMSRGRSQERRRDVLRKDVLWRSMLFGVIQIPRTSNSLSVFYFGSLVLLIDIGCFEISTWEVVLARRNGKSEKN